MKKVIFYTHGFWTRHLDDSLAIKKALFEGADDFDCIVLVDWRVGSLHDLDLFNTFKNYETAANINIPVVGEFIANFINQKLPRHIYIHLIGHSLGAQISGIAARKIKESSGRIIDRISAIDPAGPIFEYSSFLFTVNNTNTLRSSDAKFVDVIHASTVLGMINEVGHLDTYIYETDCSIFNPFCTHRRAVLFYQASINKCSQLTCSHKNLSLNGQCIIDTNSDLSSLGYLAHMYQGRGKHIARFYKSLCLAYLNVELPAKKRICREPPSPDSNCKFQPYESKCYKNETKLVCKLDKHQYLMNDYNTSDTNSLKLQTVTWVIDDNKVL
ncbi:phospholipase A1-like isoform X2 [Daktulosphaira vitifoliae]|nr:phospholipase A1-like isoform X2 [Daktulosphaira vitifoliae]